MAASKLQLLANVSQPVRAPAVLLFLFVVFIGCECRMRFVLVILLCKSLHQKNMEIFLDKCAAWD